MTEDAVPPPAFGNRERAVLEFERLGLKKDGRRDQAIHDRFGLSPTRYAQLLNRIIDEPAAIAWDPVLVNRLRRIRDDHRAKRDQRYAKGRR
jgi:hypothetical protein